ncbi:MAG: methyltransferase domain-containing protein [Pseudomonadota bacterium]
MNDLLNALDARAVRRQAERRAVTPPAAAYLFERCADVLAERFDWLATQPSTVLDVSADAGYAARQVAQRCRKARQICAGGAALVTEPRRWWQRQRNTRLVGDLFDLPLAENSIELALANLTLPWIDEPDRLFAELARVCAPDAPLLIAALGPDSFRELRDAWTDSDNRPATVPVFADMHDLGDALVRAGFVEPVLDVDRIAVRFASPAALWRDLRATGAGNVLRARRRGLTTPRQLAAAGMALDATGGGFDVTVELVFAHAFATSRTATNKRRETSIPAASIGRRRR